MEPTTTLVSCVAFYPSVAVLGSSDMPLGDGAAVPIQGQGPAEMEAKHNERCSHLCQPEPSLIVYSGLKPLLCLH